MMSSDSHKCYLCGAVFATQHGIDRHLAEAPECAGLRSYDHTIKQQHRCYLCHKTFSTQRGIDRHLGKVPGCAGRAKNQ